MKKGIFILALGHPHYGEMAYNLALSLKFSAPDIPICLGYSKGALGRIGENKAKIFDHLIEVDPKFYKGKVSNEYIKAKTALYSLSPFAETIYLDADVLWFPRRSIELIFEELKDVDFTIQTRGLIDLNAKNLPDNFSWWANVNQIRDVYGKGKYYTLSSEFIYFKKKKEVKKLFADALKVYENPGVTTTTFAGGLPDELAFSIAMIINNYYPHKDYFTPIYWEQAEKRNLQGNELYDNFYGVSAGGKILDNNTKRLLNNIAPFYYRHFGVQHPFLYKDKQSFLPERSHI